MSLRPFLRLLVKLLDVRIQLIPVDAPNPSAPDLDGGKLTRTDERIDLGNAHAEKGRYILEGQEARLYLRPAFTAAGVCSGHHATLAPHPGGSRHLTTFAPVWLRWTRNGRGRLWTSR